MPALVACAISYGFQIWISQCHGSLVSDAKMLQAGQLAFLRNISGRLPVGIAAAARFAQIGCKPMQSQTVGQLVGSGLQVSDLPQALPL